MMMRTTNVLIAGIAGTTAFTVFSYLLSEKTESNYKEPELLGKMLHRSELPVNKEQAAYSGWVVHYLIGISFAMIYESLIKQQVIRPTLKEGIITGVVSSLPAIASWSTALKIHPAPPKTGSLFYYTQLFAGHIIFAVVSILTLGFLNKKNACNHFREQAGTITRYKS